MHTDGITCIVVYDETMRGKKIIATGSFDTTIRMWHIDNKSFEHMKTLTGHLAPITFLESF